MNSLDKFKEDMKNPKFVETIKKQAEEYWAKIEERKKIVSSKEYLDWFYNYISANKKIDDESALYIYQDIDAKYGQILGAFLDYVEELAGSQKVPISSDEECDFPNEKVIVKIKDKYFELFRIYGQGSLTSVTLLNEEPTYNFVKLCL